MALIINYTNDQIGSVRVIYREKQPLFKADDIMNIMEIPATEQYEITNSLSHKLCSFFEYKMTDGKGDVIYYRHQFFTKKVYFFWQDIFLMMEMLWTGLCKTCYQTLHFNLMDVLMSNEPTIFTHPKFGDIRIIDRDGKPWFIASDVAKALGYQNISRDIRRHYKHTKLLKGTETVLLPDNPRGLLIIPESDVYRLIFGSELPSAEEFQTWVFEEVLPSLRENGYYGIRKPTLEEVCIAYLQERKQTKQLEQQITKITQQRDEISNNFGAGPDFYRVSEIP